MPRVRPRVGSELEGHDQPLALPGSVLDLERWGRPTDVDVSELETGLGCRRGLIREIERESVRMAPDGEVLIIARSPFAGDEDPRPWSTPAGRRFQRRRAPTGRRQAPSAGGSRF